MKINCENEFKTLLKQGELHAKYNDWGKDAPDYCLVGAVSTLPVNVDLHHATSVPPPPHTGQEKQTH